MWANAQRDGRPAITRVIFCYQTLPGYPKITAYIQANFVQLKLALSVLIIVCICAAV